LILVVALLVLGPKRLPEAGRSLGKGLRDFKRTINGVSDIRQEITGTEAPKPAAEPADPSPS
jgi:sec-independent protein translocase protein TatA